MRAHLLTLAEPPPREQRFADTGAGGGGFRGGRGGGGMRGSGMATPMSGVLGMMRGGGMLGGRGMVAPPTAPASFGMRGRGGGYVPRGGMRGGMGMPGMGMGMAAAPMRGGFVGGGMPQAHFNPAFFDGSGGFAPDGPRKRHRMDENA